MDIDKEPTWVFTWVVLDYSNNQYIRKLVLFRKHDWKYTDAAMEADRQYREESESEAVKPDRAGGVPSKSVCGYALLSEANARAYRNTLSLPSTAGDIEYRLVKPKRD